MKAQEAAYADQHSIHDAGLSIGFNTEGAIPIAGSSAQYHEDATSAAPPAYQQHSIAAPPFTTSAASAPPSTDALHEITNDDLDILFKV